MAVYGFCELKCEQDDIRSDDNEIYKKYGCCINCNNGGNARSRKGGSNGKWDNLERKRESQIMKALNVIGILLLYIAISTGVAMACEATFSPCAGIAGTSVTISGANWHTFRNISINFNGTNIPWQSPTKCVSNSSKKFTCTFTVPANAISKTTKVILSETNGSSPYTNRVFYFDVISSISWNNPVDITYGTALSTTQLNAAKPKLGTNIVSGNLMYTPPINTVLSAGPHTLHVVFTPQNSCYPTLTKDVTINVIKKTASVTSNSSSKTFGDPDPAFSGTLSGFLTADGITASYSRTPGEAVGNYIINATLSPVVNLSNYSITYNTATFTITPATSTVTVNCPLNEIYTGLALTPCTATYSGSGLSGSLTPTHSNNVDVGTATASATYAGDANHTGSSGLDTFEITKASSTVTVICPASGQLYTGSEITPCSASYSTDDGQTGQLAVTYTNNVEKGTATASATYPGDDNHEGSINSGTFEITGAPAVEPPTNVPEFPTLALPIAAVIGLVFFFQSKKKKEE